ncbi:complement C1q domain-containing protein [Dyadobacter sp. CY323]|uniref:complement C1q domain-containing protein n=1 Tax=Dyadobacter sp. CY323 TaxID=2907302 RepID=UPI001F3ED6A0|nr:complement C1q domain-containing protein [Dyadobacter sp. CY323]MCE6990088.1 complement C1q domain-containing protein [Dyadobacter sp. CY323]
MKKLTFFLALLITGQSVFGQGTGINTLDPHPSAALDVQSNNGGILIPRISLNSLTDKLTISSPANGLFLFNINSALPGGKGFYFNNNSSQNPAWTNVAFWSLPFQSVSTKNGPAFQIDNYQGSSSGIAIKGFGALSGTGIYAQSELGFAMAVTGKMKIMGNGQTPDFGKVLTSDLAGNATWEGAIAFSALGIKGEGSEKIAKDVATKIPFDFVSFDLQNNYTNAEQAGHSTFTAPTDGIYNFDVQVSWEPRNFDENFDTVVQLVRKRNGNESVMAEKKCRAAFSNTSFINTDLNLQLGDQICVKFLHFQYDYVKLYTSRELNHFTGSLIMKL